MLPGRFVTEKFTGESTASVSMAIDAHAGSLRDALLQSAMPP
jgi:hypothetical protein